MMRIQTPEGMKPLPRKWSFWQHKKNRTIYQVTEVSNLSEKQGDYPVTISYMGQDGQPWSMAASKWYDKMEPATEMMTKLLKQYEGQVLTPAVMKAIIGVWEYLMLQNEVDVTHALKFKISPVFVPAEVVTQPTDSRLTNITIKVVESGPESRLQGTWEVLFAQFCIKAVTTGAAKRAYSHVVFPGDPNPALATIFTIMIEPDRLSINDHLNELKSIHGVASAEIAATRTPQPVSK